MRNVGIAIYFDINLNAFISPILHNESGVGIGSNEVIELYNNYTKEMLAGAIIRGLEISFLNDFSNQKESSFWKKKINYNKW